MKQLFDFHWQTVIYSSKKSVGWTSFLSIPFCVKLIWGIFMALKFGCSIPDRIFWTSLKIKKNFVIFFCQIVRPIDSSDSFWFTPIQTVLTFVPTFIYHIILFWQFKWACQKLLNLSNPSDRLSKKAITFPEIAKIKFCYFYISKCY